MLFDKRFSGIFLLKNKIKLFTLLSIVTAVFAFACANKEMSGNLNNSVKSVEKQTYKSVGVVKKIDAEKGEITIDHEDIPGYMSAMEMTEPVKDKALLDSIKIGDKIEFDIERTGSDIVFTRFLKIGEDGRVKSASIYKTNCAECHGEKGEGVKGKGIPLISGHALHHSEDEHIEQVTDGESEKMPAFKNKLSTEEIKAVVGYVRNDIQKEAKRDDGTKHKH